MTVYGNGTCKLPIFCCHPQSVLLRIELTDELREFFSDLGFKADIKLAVVKNTLLAKAMDASDREFGELPSVLKGNTSLMFSEVGNAPAKLIKSFRKKSEKPLLKGAFVEEAVYIGDENLDALVSIKSKEEMIGEIIGLLQSPAKNVISGLKSGGGKLAGILKTLSER